MASTKRLTPPEEGDNLAGAWAAPLDLFFHQGPLGFEKELRGAVHRAVDAEALGKGAVYLPKQMHDLSPDGRRQDRHPADPAFLDHAQQMICLAQLAPRRGRLATLPGPEPVLRDLQDGALDHMLWPIIELAGAVMEEQIESTPVYRGRLFQVFKDRVRLDGGREATREIVRHPGSVGIIPRDERGRIVLVRQFRYVTGRELWEIPAGTCDKEGEDVDQAARRELAEETGLQAGRWKKLGRAYLVPGYDDEQMTFYLAEDLTPTEAHAELDESFKVNPFDLHDLRVLRSSGELIDAKTLLGLSWARLDIWSDPQGR